MHTSEARHGSRNELGRTELSPMVVRDAILTAIGTLALASIAVIHLVQIVPLFVEVSLVALGRHALTVKRALRPVPVSVLATTNGHGKVSSEQRLESA